MFIYKKDSRWPAILRITQGGANFKQWDSLSTNLSGIELEFKLPSTVSNLEHRHPPPAYLDINSIDWDECSRLATRVFDEKEIFREIWEYRGNFWQTTFNSIGGLHMRWFISRFDPQYGLKDNHPDSVIDYFKAYIHDAYENEGCFNDRIRKREYNKFKDKTHPEEYQDLMKRHIQMYSLKHPDDYQWLPIHGNQWIRFSNYESWNSIFHILPLNRHYFLMNTGKFIPDCHQERYRWADEAEKIIEQVMASVKVTFPADWKF